jgi:mannan endo-1,4-beta-mannosidase
VLANDTPEHKLWLADVDAIAKVLDNLRQRGVVVLFRPYHEMNRDYFWWGQKDGYPQLWDALYDELVVRHKLDNLIWVWSIDRDTPDAKPYYPLRPILLKNSALIAAFTV